ncbi:hypothetical protein DLE01_04010, partial [Streptomyces sp. FT05W]
MNRQNGAERPYDVILFGATGFVGELTAAYLAAHAPDGPSYGRRPQGLVPCFLRVPCSRVPMHMSLRPVDEM